MTFVHDEVIEKLKAISLFGSFSNRPDVLRLVVRALSPLQVNKNERIITEGDPGDEMYILLKGEIEISKYTMEKEQFTVAKLRDSMNVFFGEQGLVDQDKRSASVTALTDCELLVLTRDKFRLLAEEHNDVGYHMTLEIAEILSKRLRKANEDAVVFFEALVNELAGQ
jgi:CRP/FNR family transcriptional regulator, cyclic AMP receptor protein